ncbi:MAG: HEAT repeat domain-containing protein [Bacteroidetes bacterium]|nr:HEAT repeat domain-containing protein [Bacteroidota bacterium]
MIREAKMPFVFFRIFGLFFLLTAIVLLFVSGCSKQQSEKRVDKNLFKEVKVIRIVIKQTYTYNSENTPNLSFSFMLPFKQVAKEILEKAGFVVVGEETKKYDATLLVNAKCKAIGQTYGGELPGFYYTGARITGKIILETFKNRAKYTSSFETYSPPLLNVLVLKDMVDIPDSPDKAPLKELLWGIRPNYSSYMNLDLGIPSCIIDYSWELEPFPLKLLEIIATLYGNEKLIPLLKGTPSGLRFMIIKTFEKVRDEKTTDALISALDNEVLYVRHLAIRTMGEVNDPRFVEYLIGKLISEKEWFVRASAADALYNIAATADAPSEIKNKVFEALISVLNDRVEKEVDQSLFRESVVITLGKFKDPRAINPLITLLEKETKNESTNVRSAIIGVLSDIGDERAIEPLKKLSITDPYDYVRDEATEALEKLKSRLSQAKK